MLTQRSFIIQGLNYQGKIHVSLEQKIYELRQEKLREIEKLGQPAYPYKFEFTHTVPQILAEYGEKAAEQLEMSIDAVYLARSRILGRLRELGKGLLE